MMWTLSWLTLIVFLFYAGWLWRNMECRGISSGVCLLFVAGDCSSHSFVANWNNLLLTPCQRPPCPQCHLYLFHSSRKKPKSFTLLSAIVLCNFYLLGLRNPWQLIFHVSVASLSTFLILTRKLQDRTNDCGVWGARGGEDGITAHSSFGAGERGRRAIGSMHARYEDVWLFNKITCSQILCDHGKWRQYFLIDSSYLHSVWISFSIQGKVQCCVETDYQQKKLQDPSRPTKVLKKMKDCFLM